MNVLPLNTDRIIRTIHEGNYFCSELIFQQNSQASIVVAASCCQIHVLYKKDLTDIANKFPLFEKKSLDKLSPLLKNVRHLAEEISNADCLSPTNKQNANNKTEVFRMKSFQINCKGIDFFLIDD